MPREKKRVRLSFDVSPAVKARIAGLVERSDCDSMTEVVRRSLALYECAIEGMEGGHRIVMRHESGTDVVIGVLL